MLDAIAVVLAGGKSTRLGRDKRWVELDGQPLLLRSVGYMNQVFDSVVVSSNDEPRGLSKDIKVIPDLEYGLGPLGGIYSCLKMTQAPLMFVSACDAPFPSRALIETMFPMTNEASIVVPESERGLEPLFAFYRFDCLPAIEARLKSGNSQVISIYDDVNVRKVGVDELASIDCADDSFINVNRQRDLDRADEFLSSGWEF